MRTRVVLLRQQGQKRPEADLRDDPGATGELFVVDGFAALVAAPPGCDRTLLKWNQMNLLPTLHEVTLGRIRLDEWVLIGVEKDPKTLEPSPQAWWCRLATDSG